MKKLNNRFYIDNIEKVVAMIKNMKRPMLSSGFIRNNLITSISVKESVEEKTITIDLCDFCQGDGTCSNWVIFDDNFLDSMRGKTVKFIDGSKVELTTEVKTKILFISCGEKKLSIMYKEETFGDDVILFSDIPVFAEKEYEAFPDTIYIMENRYDNMVIGEIFDDTTR